MKKLLLLNLAFFAFVGCSNYQNNVNQEVPFTFDFENFSFGGLPSMESLLSRYDSEVISEFDTLFDNMDVLYDTASKVSEELLDILLESDVINELHYSHRGECPLSIEERAVYINEMKENRHLFYLGEIRISGNFRSFLFLSDFYQNDLYFQNGSVFLINVKKGDVKSIVKVYDYLNYAGVGRQIYTVKHGKNMFRQSVINWNSDLIIPDDYKEPYVDTTVVFQFDRNGYLQIRDLIERQTFD